MTKLDKKADSVTATIDDGKGGTSQLTVDRVISAVGVVGNVENLGLDKLGVKMDKRGHIEVNDRLEWEQIPRPLRDRRRHRRPLPRAPRAEAEGVVCAEVIAGEPAAYDVRAMPAAIFTDPRDRDGRPHRRPGDEVEGYEVKVGKFPFAPNGGAPAPTARTRLRAW